MGYTGLASRPEHGENPIISYVIFSTGSTLYLASILRFASDSNVHGMAMLYPMASLLIATRY
jgi:hypothetical protein